MEKSIKFKISRKDIILIVITSLISLGIGYVFWFIDKKPVVSFDILSNTEVFSVNTKVDNLTVKYGDQDLSNSNKKLVLLTIRYSNSGDEVLLENDYFSKIPLGFKILNGSIVDDPEIINSSNNVLKDYTLIVRKGLDSVLIDKPPLAIKDFLIFKILVVTDKQSEEVKLKSIGSIGGTKKITVNEAYKKSDTKSKSFWDQVLITFGYIFIGFIILIILYSIIQPKDMNIQIDMESRKVIAERFLKKHPPEDQITNKIVEYYIKYGLHPLKNCNLSSNLKHFYWNEFPYNSNEIEEFEAMRKLLLEMEELGCLKVNKDDNFIMLNDEVKRRIDKTYNILDDWQDSMNRGFEFG